MKKPKTYPNAIYEQLSQFINEAVKNRDLFTSRFVPLEGFI